VLRGSSACPWFRRSSQASLAISLFLSWSISWRRTASPFALHERPCEDIRLLVDTGRDRCRGRSEKREEKGVGNQPPISRYDATRQVCSA